MTYAIAKTPDGATYVSPLFAIKFDGGSSAAIGWMLPCPACKSWISGGRCGRRGIPIPPLSDACSSSATSTAMPQRSGAVWIG